MAIMTARPALAIVALFISQTAFAGEPIGQIKTQAGTVILERAGATKPAKAGLLTPREQQILQWIYHGKSNIEIGMILNISPLTVKNHVQKTLRKLNVLNRTQAVGRALALRIVNP